LDGTVLRKVALAHKWLQNAALTLRPDNASNTTSKRLRAGWRVMSALSRWRFVDHKDKVLA
jgi:hypothetical protein